MLFNRSGYVLNFSTNDFDVFTTNSIGEALCAKYGLSKGKSLIAYLNSASDENRFKLLSDLFHYYEENPQHSRDVVQTLFYRLADKNRLNPAIPMALQLVVLKR